MNNQIKRALLTLSIVSSTAFPFSAHAESEGGANGGGGGGICVNRRCQSLVEVGFRVATPEFNKGFEVEFETIEQLDYISQVAPGIAIKTENIIEKDSIVLIETADPVKSKKFLDEYKALLSSQGETDLANSVDLLAFSTNGKTYLIKNKYEGMSARSKALLLIHERNIRVGSPLKYALHFDGVLLEAINAIEAGRRPDNIELLVASAGVYAINPETAARLVFGEIIHLNGGAMSTIDLFGEEIPYTNSANPSINLTYDALLRARSVYPKISQLIDHVGQINVVSLGARGQQLVAQIDSVINGRKKFVIDSENIQENLRVETKIAFSKCGDRSDIRKMLAAMPEYKSQLNTFYGLGYADCSAYSGYDLGKILHPIVGTWIPTTSCQVKNHKLQCKAQNK